MRKLLYYSICGAQEDIYITTAYFTPSIRMLRCLGDAVSRGVRVRMLLPGKSDIIAAHYAGRAFFTHLLKSGVEIYNYQGEMLHAKTAIFDCNWSVVGSANLDFQSLRRNDEGNVGILDRNFADQMVELFSEDLKQSEQIKLEVWRERGLWEKIKESFFVIFRMRL
jgi:cardiolipin synthase